MDVQDFDLTGNLTIAGRTMFWKEVNKSLEKFDRDEITLRPRKCLGNTPTSAPSKKVLIKSIIKDANNSTQRKLPMSQPKKSERTSKSFLK